MEILLPNTVLYRTFEEYMAINIATPGQKVFRRRKEEE